MGNMIHHFYELEIDTWELEEWAQSIGKPDAEFIAMDCYFEHIEDEYYRIGSSYQRHKGTLTLQDVIIDGENIDVPDYIKEWIIEDYEYQYK